MARPRRLFVDPEQPQSQVDMTEELTLQLEGRTSFGNPQDPDERVMDSVVLAGSGAAIHPGTLENIEGSWVEIEVEDITLVQECFHNLGAPVAVAGSPNVRWILFMFQHDGTQKLWWDDLRVPMSSTKKGGRDPTFGLFLDDGKAPSRGVWIEWFTPGPQNEEEVFFAVQMPHQWKAGTDIVPHVHWTPKANAAADECVKWGLEYTWANIGDVFPVTEIIYSDATDDTTQTLQGVTLVANTHYTSEFTLPANGLPMMAGAGKTISSMLVCRLFRNTDDASDDYPDDAGLLEFDFHYQIDAPGSDGELIKNVPIDMEQAPFQVYFREGDAVAEDSIELRVAADPHIEIDFSHKLKLSLFFIRAIK